MLVFYVCPCFMFFGLKDARSEDGERRYTQPQTYLGETKRILKNFRRIFMTAATKPFTVAVCRDIKLCFIRHLFLYGIWTFCVTLKIRYKEHESAYTAVHSEMMFQP
jgi:hypothetical protein